MAEYDKIAKEYQESKQLPFRTYIETYTFFQTLGNIERLNILDLACGEGFFTRKLKLAGAAQAYGVDVSAEMIQLAQQIEQQTTLGCQYAVHDVATMPHLGEFDVVTAMYLLNYAATKAQLLAFTKAAYAQLKSGGRFVGFNDNVAADLATYHRSKKYGFIKEAPLDRKEGDAIRYTFYNADGTVFQFNNFYLHPATYDEAFLEAGFKSFRWVPPQLDPTQRAQAAYWDDFLRDKPLIGFIAEK
ncbi:MAG: class I SAM-dependent methyltransferase [Bacteroidota bacterium]